MSPAVGALIVFIPGFWTSLQSGLPEPFAAATVVAALVFLWCDRPLLAAVVFAISLLIRETALIAVACVVAGRLASGRRQEAVLFAAIAITPVLIWRPYVGWVFYPDWGWNAFFYRPPAGAPLAGTVTLWNAITRGGYNQTAPALISAATLFPFLLLAGLLVAVSAMRAAPSAIALAAVLYGIGAASLAFESVWVHAGNAQRLTYEMFIMLAMAMAAVNTYPRWIRSMLIVFWTAAAVYTFWGAADADLVRDAVLRRYFSS